MGYRSDVVIGIVSKRVEEFKTLLDECELPADEVDEREFYATFTWESIKWYEEVGCICAITKYLAPLSEGATKKAEYGFIRLGEECGDIEMKGMPLDFGIYYTQKIMIRD